MNVLWYKVWYDLWRNKLRTLLVVVSIAVGVFAVGTTFGMVDQMIPVMDAAHQSTTPSHLTIYLHQPISRDVLPGLEKVPGVESVEGSNTVDIRYKLQPGEKWRKGSVLMRDDYSHQTYDVLQLKAGVWPSGDDLSIERMHSAFYGIDIGDRVIFEVDGKERSFAITGKIRHPFVPPPSMYDWAWFFCGPEVMELFGVPQNQFTELKLRVYPYSDENAHMVATAVKERLTKQGVDVVATVYQDPNKHWGRSFIDGMTMVIQVLAVISMLLSVVLVLNTLTAVITQQTNQIGILKAIGGSSQSVTGMFLAGVLAYGLLAMLIALPLGSLASFSITSWFLGFYNIEYNTFAFSKTTLVYQAMAALAVPLLAALYPVLHGAGITVREAIASYGLGGDFSSGWIDRAVEKFCQRFLISYYADALVNIFRRKGRLLLTQGVLVIAGVMFLMVMSLSSSINATLDSEFNRRSYDMTISFEDLQRVDRTSQMVETVPGVEAAGMWLIRPVTILHGDQKAKDAGLGSQLQGVPLDDSMYTPFIVAGRWLQPGDEYVIVMQRETAEDEHIRIGDVVRLDLGEYGSRDWQVVGFYQAFLMFGGGFNVDAIYAPRQAVYTETHKVGRGSTLFVRTTEHTVDSTNLVANRLEDLFEARNMDVAQIETMPTTRRTADTSFSMVVGMLLALALIVALVGGIGLMGSLWISVIERTREIGVMRAIGARSTAIMSMFVLEGVVQGLISWLIAVPISLAVSPVMANALGVTIFQTPLEFQFNYTAVFTWLGVILAIALFAAIIPARNATQINVRQSLSYE